MYKKMFSVEQPANGRVPAQVLHSLIKSYIGFFIYKALQSLIFFGIFIKKSLIFDREERMRTGICGFNLK